MVKTTIHATMATEGYLLGGGGGGAANRLAQAQEVTDGISAIEKNGQASSPWRDDVIIIEVVVVVQRSCKTTYHTSTATLLKVIGRVKHRWCESVCVPPIVATYV
jgi:hypothetical protein